MDEEKTTALMRRTTELVREAMPDVRGARILGVESQLRNRPDGDWQVLIEIRGRTGTLHRTTQDHMHDLYDRVADVEWTHPTDADGIVRGLLDDDAAAAAVMIATLIAGDMEEQRRRAAAARALGVHLRTSVTGRRYETGHVRIDEWVRERLYAEGEVVPRLVQRCLQAIDDDHHFAQVDGRDVGAVLLGRGTGAVPLLAPKTNLAQGCTFDGVSLRIPAIGRLPETTLHAAVGRRLGDLVATGTALDERTVLTVGTSGWMTLETRAVPV